MVRNEPHRGCPECAVSLMVQYAGVAINAFAVPLNATNPALQGKSVRLREVQHVLYPGPIEFFQSFANHL
jgi:hypothetical protein